MTSGEFGVHEKVQMVTKQLHRCHRSLTRLGGSADQPTPCENISTTGLQDALLTNGMKVVYVTPELCHRPGTTERVNALTTPHVLYSLRRGALVGLLLIWKLENAELTYWICVYIECGCDLK